jgi:hypothetical protein
VNVQVLTPHAGDPAILTRLLVTATSGDFGTADAGSDYIKSLVLDLTGNVLGAGGVTLSDSKGLLNPITDAINTTGQPGLFTDEIDVTAPARQSINNSLGITAFNDETEGFGSPAEASAATAQPIVIDFSENSQTDDFQAANQSIWTTGTAFTTDLHKFLGIGTTNGPQNFGGTIGTTVLGFGAKAGVTLSVKAGFQVDLHIDSGSLNADLPFNVTLDSTYNKTTDTLVIDPTETGLPGGQISSTGPNGNLEIDLVLEAMVKYFAKAIAFGTTVFSIPPPGNGHIGPPTLPNLNTTIVKLDSSKLTTKVPIPPVGTPLLNVTFAWPQLNTDPTGSGPGTATSAGTSNPIANFNIDLIAAALDALGIAEDPLNFSAGPINLDLLSLNLGFDVNTQQQLNLSALGLNPTLTLEDGTPVPNGPGGFQFGSPLTIPNASIHDSNHDGAIDLNLTLTPNANLQNITGVGGELSGGLTVGKIDAEGFSGALFDHPVTIPIGSIPIFKNTFAVNFQPQTEHVSIG